MEPVLAVIASVCILLALVFALLARSTTIGNSERFSVRAGVYMLLAFLFAFAFSVFLTIALVSWIF